MSEQGNAPQQESGFFAPKQVELSRQPLTGKQLSVRIMIAVGAVILIVVGYFWFTDAYKRPVNRYYSGYEDNDAKQMAKAFPDFLRNAKTTEGQMDVVAMCDAALMMKKVYYGENCKVQQGITHTEPIEEARLQQIERGIKSRYHESVSVSKGLKCTVNVIYTLEDGKEQQVTEYATVYRIDGSWYLLDVITNQSEKKEE